MIGTPSVPTVGTHLKKVPKSKKKREESNIALGEIGEGTAPLRTRVARKHTHANGTHPY
jgi:hypothetical protein